MKRSCVLAAATVLGLGCGGDDDSIDTGPSAMQGTANATVMKSSALQADTLRAAIDAKNGAGIAACRDSAKCSAAATAAVLPANGVAMPLTVQETIAIMQAQTTMTGGSVNCTETGCTFDKYGVSGANSFSISGSLKTTDAGNGAKHVVWSLTGTGNFTGQQSTAVGNLQFSYQWKGDLTVSPTSVTGAAGSTWSGSGMTNGQSFNYDFGSYLKLDNVTFGVPDGHWWQRLCQDVDCGERRRPQQLAGLPGQLRHRQLFESRPRAPSLNGRRSAGRQRRPAGRRARRSRRGPRVLGQLAWVR